MKQARYLSLLISITLLSALSSAQDLKLWYKSPASSWIEGLPLGNGSLMAVVEGGVHHERIQLNEETLWSGHHVARDNPEGAAHLDEIRQMFFDGMYYEGEQMVRKKMIGRSLEFGRNCYQTMGNLDFFFRYGDPDAKLTNYHRELDLNTATVGINYKNGDVNYSREVFVSAPDQALVIKLTADTPGMVNFSFFLSREGAETWIDDQGKMVMKGMAGFKDDPDWKGVSFETQLIIENKAGEMKTSGKGVDITGADEVIIKLVAATDYKGKDPAAICEQRIGSIEAKPYTEVHKDHLADYQSYFNRVVMELNYTGSKFTRINKFHGQSPPASLPTNKRIEAVGQGIEDPDLLSLYFQYGRYLLISASRPGNIAINLWGKWVDSYAPSYDADYHTNINIPMNYWPAGITNLAECYTPFFDLIDSLRINGRISAKMTYGADGFVAHHATDHSYYTTMIGNPPHGVWAMTPTWGCHQMWDHYLYTGDVDYLREKSWPIMKEAAAFIVDYLVEDPNLGYLVSGPSCSPENRFITEEGKRVSLSMGTAMDMQLIRDLFTNCIEACKVLDTDHKFRKQLEKMLPKLLPNQIGKDGRLMEWAYEFPENDIAHKHASHLWGLLEDEQISPEKTPELAKAARKSLDIRVKHGMGQTHEFRAITSWAASAYCRLWDAEETYKHLKFIMGQSSHKNLMAVSFYGLTRGMWETDANLGAASVIAEMFLQSHNGDVHLLPALPAKIDKGSVSGLMARGAFEVDMEWSEGKLERVKIESKNGGPCTVKYADIKAEFETVAGEVMELDGALRKIEK